MQDYLNDPNDKTSHHRPHPTHPADATRRQINGLKLAVEMLEMVGANWDLSAEDIQLLYPQFVTRREATAAASEIGWLRHIRRDYRGTDQLDHIIVDPADGERLLDEEIACLRSMAHLLELGEL